MGILFALGGLGLVAEARASGFYQYVQKKQETKAKSRWTLQEWLSTKDRIEMMDLWLAFNTPSPFEFYIGGDYGSGEFAGAPRATTFGMHAAAYASLFGLEGRYRTGARPETQALFNFRIFGFQTQGTNLTLQGGLRFQEGVTAPGESSRNASVGGTTTIYLGRYFGVDALYRKHFRSVPTISGTLSQGSQFEVGAFIEFNVFRVYGTYFAERVETVSGANVSGATGRGFTVGTRLYF